MKVQDFMITDVISVRGNTTVRELLQILVANKIGGVPVVGESNELVGVISDGDVIRYLNPSSRTVFDMFAIVMVTEREKLSEKLIYTLNEPVSVIMKSRDIKTLRPDNDLEDALQIFSRHRFKKLPVVDKTNTVVGVISRGDLLRHITTAYILPD
ncbi:CBS domain-containing protein [Ornithinibacillus contaminans]|uniref:CBS domain-containing protein n=1 Tax=Ornithinibacillus contaminans TaxID=694055 RepID=UPI00064DE4E5|nr:CBS domain-containing protein [Ornithinibacillus contaminans]